ncbi:hypothetical protein B0H13DRAFT_1667752 [Mycena leptocephala]|nr:hypothetical protein B0H13DRAFT_1667752 [Mycena leptocephala]
MASGAAPTPISQDVAGHITPRGAGVVSPPSSHPLEFSAEAPAWLRESLRVLSYHDLGYHYRSLLETLIRVEERFGFDANPRHGVSTEERPREVHDWIRAGRGLRSKKAYDAHVTDVDDYEQRWGIWWDSLQPEWRKKVDGKWKIYDGYESGWDWGTLSSPGQNGCLCLVASLYFWGMAKKDHGTDDGNCNAGIWGRWDWAVQDVLWMMEGVEASLPARKVKGKGRAK